MAAVPRDSGGVTSSENYEYPDRANPSKFPLTVYLSNDSHNGEQYYKHNDITQNISQ